VCKGEGIVTDIDVFAKDDNITTEICDTCKGSGRVWVSSTTVIKVEPYDGCAKQE
jgi:DnaJ-class molecular chaperone